MEKNIFNFIQTNSPDGGFLQSEYWRKFQEGVGRKTHNLSETGEEGKLIAFANIITHKLPVAGDYFYVPRGPVLAQNSKLKAQNHNAKFKTFISKLINLAEENNVGWIRIEPNSEEELKLIKESLPEVIKIKKSFVDMQPREILTMDISKNDEEILAGMKQKTRYNIKLSQKRGVSVKVISNFQFPISKSYIAEFLRLVRITAERDKITSHPESYYRKMFETIPSDILKLYIAKYEAEIIAANLILFFGHTATYMHGASDNAHRDVMAPYLLQWQQIIDAKKTGCERYDFGGVKTQPHPSPCLIGRQALPVKKDNSWSGITKFKQGFAPDLQPIQFPRCYDIMLNPFKYHLYRILQRIKKIV